MTTTTNYGLNLVEGTDIVNPLVQQNPNYTAIDTAMFANKQASIGSATEVKAGTVHTITRANTDSNYVRFTATSNWTAGDSMIIDSTPVSVYLSDGTVPGTGAYIINTEVFLIVNGSRVTLLTSTGAENAANVAYNNASSGLTATNVQDAIDEVAGSTLVEANVENANVGSGSINVYKKGDLIIIDLNRIVLANDLASNNEVIIGSISSAYRPTHKVSFCGTGSASGLNHPVGVYVDESGNIVTVNYSTGNSKLYYYGQIMYSTL